MGNIAATIQAPNLSITSGGQIQNVGNLLGSTLTQAQIASLTQPILWYVEETVPAPNCTATGGATCPTVTALMPQVYLPPNYNAQTAEGNIEGSNVTLNFNGSGGSVLNTGNITASNTLTVNTSTLTNQQNSTNVGQIWNYIQDTGYEETTGTMAQPGGTMSAGNMVLNVQAVNQIGGALQQLSSDGAVNTAATQQLLSTLQTQLGSAFQQSTVTNDLQTSFVKEGGDFNVQDLVGMVAAIAISVAMGPQMFSFYNGLIDPIGLMTVSPELAIAGSALATGLAAGTTALAAGAASQIISTGNLNIGQDFEGALVSALSAGVTQGILGSTGVTNLGTFVTQATSGVTSSTVVNVAGQAVISAGVQTAIEGGSFLNALKTDAVNDASADLAFTIGQADANNEFGTGLPGEIGYVVAHGLLGCAASAAAGTGCAGGAIGAAASAVATPFFISAVDQNGATELNPGQSAIVTALAALTGSATAGLSGANAQAGAIWAENEAQNNDLNDIKAALSKVYNFVQTATDPLYNGILKVSNYLLLQEYGHQSPPVLDNPFDPQPPTTGGGAVTVTSGIPYQVMTPEGIPVTVQVPYTFTLPSGPILSNGNGSSGDDNSNGSNGNSGSSSTGTGSGNQTAVAPAPTGEAAATPSQPSVATKNAVVGSVANANFAQSSINAAGTFSAEGASLYSQLAGVPINTVDDLATAIKNGLISPSQLPVNYVVTSDGTQLILNTRTAAALNDAGIPQSQWSGVNQTGVQVPGMPAGTTFDDLAAAQLKNNRLPPTGTSNLPTGSK